MKRGGLNYGDSLNRSGNENIVFDGCVYVEPNTIEERWEGALYMVAAVTVQGGTGFKDATASVVTVKIVQLDFQILWFPDQVVPF